MQRPSALASAPVDRPAPAAVIELLKPITWFAPMWAFGCGLVSGGVTLPHQAGLALGGIVLAGPLLCGASQAVNDWYDRHVDAINEPGRPIPSGRVPGRWGLAIAVLVSGLALVWAAALGPWVLIPAALGSVLAWAYSAPPLRLKANGWFGNAAVALSYEGLAWLAGAAVVAGTRPDGHILALALLYSLGAHGIMTLNDFKAVDGDSRMGIRSLPVQLGVAGAARVACGVMLAPQVVVVALLAGWGRPGFASVLALLALVQVALMPRLLADPKAQAPWYNATGTSLYVLGMMVSAVAVRSLVLGVRGAPAPDAAPGGLGWLGIVRLGLVQAALGAVVVMTTTTLNRVMVVELALPAVVPGGLVAVHYAVQLLRPRWGFGADGTGRRTPWILGGLALLSAGGLGAALSVALMPSARLPGLVLALASYLLVGLGVGAAGTAVLTLAATRVAPARRSAAAATLWIMMIAGFAVTAGVAGSLLSPFSLPRLVAVVGGVCAVALALGSAAMAGLEGAARPPSPAPAARPGFGPALRALWGQTAVRRFALFVFASTLAYGSQDLVLDPFAGRILGLSPADTTRLSGLQHGGALVGMLAVALAGAVLGRRRPGFPRVCAMAGCALSGVVLLGLAVAASRAGPGLPLRPLVALLGFGNGVFAVAAIGAMLALAGAEGSDHAGLRMGLFGGAQALAFGLGAVAAPALVDGVTALVGSPAPAYAAVFGAEAVLFLLSARLVAAAVPSGAPSRARAPFATVAP